MLDAKQSLRAIIELHICSLHLAKTEVIGLLKKNGFLLFICFLFLAGCQQSPEVLVATPTLEATAIVLPSATIAPTLTSEPTIPPAPTETAAPTAVVAPTNTPQPTAAPQNTPTTAPAVLDRYYSVINLTGNNLLKVYAEPSSSSSVINTLAANAKGIRGTSNRTDIAGEFWQEIILENGSTGWVQMQHITEEMSSDQFCADPQIDTLLEDFITAIDEKSGKQLSALVSEPHGWAVRLFRYGNIANYNTEEAKWVFISTYEMNWGPAPGSGMDTIGNFHETVLPRLEETFASDYQTDCDTYENTPIFILEPVPPEWQNIHYLSIVQPGTPGVDLDWRAWLLGIEYVGGKPKLFSLISFEWEP